MTVVADESMVADALSTALFVLGMERGLGLLRSIANCPELGYRSIEALFVTMTREVHLTPGLAEAYTSLNPSPAIVCRIPSYSPECLAEPHALCHD